MDARAFDYEHFVMAPSLNVQMARHSNDTLLNDFQGGRIGSLFKWQRTLGHAEDHAANFN